MDKFERLAQSQRIVDALPMPDGYESFFAGGVNTQLVNAYAAQPATPSIWPELQPLHAKIEGLDYPTHCLPTLIRHAVEEVQGFVQAPSTKRPGGLERLVEREPCSADALRC